MSGWIAASVGGAALIGGAASYFGGQQAANSAQSGAMAQLGVAEQQRSQAMGFAQTAGSTMMNLAQATPQELNALGTSYSAASQNLQQQQQLMASIDPALMSASKQALSLLQGGTAAATAPMLAMRNQQRAQLVNSLQSQYGPGAESTSIGQQALNNFDMQTNSMNFGMAQGLQGMAEQGASSMNQNQLAAMGGLQQVGQGYGALQQRQLGAASNAYGLQMSAMNGTAAPVYNSAGAGAVGGVLQGQGLAALGQNVGNAGTTLGMMYGLQGSKASMGGYNPSVGNPAANWNPQGVSMPAMGS